jgi:hypothetical protein
MQKNLADMAAGLEESAKSAGPAAFFEKVRAQPA